METTIGEAAGQIWQYLDRHGTATLPQLQRETGLTERLLLMGVGWLARESQLSFQYERRTLMLALKTPQEA
jgi:hypothetical protein